MTREELRYLRDRLIARDIAIRTEVRRSRDKWRVAEEITLIAAMLIAVGLATDFLGRRLGKAK